MPDILFRVMQQKWYTECQEDLAVAIADIDSKSGTETVELGMLNTFPVTSKSVPSILPS